MSSTSTRTHILEQMTRRVSTFTRASALASRLDALVDLVAFVRGIEPDVELLSSEWSGEPLEPDHRRLALFAAWLERSPETAGAFKEALTATLAVLRGLSLFAEGGVANDRGVLVEAADRIARRLLPSPRADRDLAALLPRLFPDKAALEWLDTMPPELFARALALLPSTDAWRGLRADMEEALSLLATRISALGLGEEMRVRRGDEGVRTSPYHAIVQSTSASLRVLDAGADSDAERDASTRWAADVVNCRRGNEEVRTHLETHGVSVAVVYSLEVIERLLDRMHRLFDVLEARESRARAAALRTLTSDLVRGRLNDRSLLSLVRENLSLLARKIIERTGQTGEHYITTTLREWLGMLGSAAGGGLITTFTAVVKLFVSQAHFPVLVEFALSGTNYALSFVAIQLLGYTLATKQPGMTAATLAGILREPAGPARSQELATHIARIVRSQLAAAFGNIVAVSVGAVLFELAWSRRYGAPFLDAEKVDHVLRSLDPTASGTIGYAAWTGVLLWLSGLFAGWVGNWVVYRRLPEAIADHRLGERFGPHRLQSVSRWFAANVSGLGGSVALGYLLAATPALGHATGLPLDVRHVTLSSGQLVLAATTLGSEAFHDPRVHTAMIGIAVIFALNFGTSFLLALGVAARARNATLWDMRDVGAALLRRLARRPHEFILPPLGKSAGQGQAH